MTKNNHFDNLNRLLRGQAPGAEAPAGTSVYEYALTLARIENAVVVVSDLAAGTSRIFAGGFAGVLKLEGYTAENSIWEKEILRLMPEQEQQDKFIAELRFFHYLRHLPRHRKPEYFLMSRLRFSNGIDVLHRMYYIYDTTLETVLYAVCIYSPPVFDLPAKNYVINSVTGIREELTPAANATVISRRERQVLQLIADGKKSADIAEALHISKNTVSRHRQEILAKLKVKNSVAACRLAESMGLIIFSDRKAWK